MWGKDVILKIIITIQPFYQFVTLLSKQLLKLMKQLFLCMLLTCLHYCLQAQTCFFTINQQSIDSLSIDEMMPLNIQLNLSTTDTATYHIGVGITDEIRLFRMNVYSRKSQQNFILPTSFFTNAFHGGFLQLFAKNETDSIIAQCKVKLYSKKIAEEQFFKPKIFFYLNDNQLISPLNKAIFDYRNWQQKSNKENINLKIQLDSNSYTLAYRDTLQQLRDVNYYLNSWSYVKVHLHQTPTYVIGQWKNQNLATIQKLKAFLDTFKDCLALKEFLVKNPYYLPFLAIQNNGVERFNFRENEVLTYFIVICGGQFSLYCTYNLSVIAVKDLKFPCN